MSTKELNARMSDGLIKTPELQTSVEGRSARCGGSADSLSAELGRVRAEKKPTKRGILVCGQVMGQMLQLGWRKDQLDALELMFWLVRDADGRVIKNPPNDKLTP